MFSRVTTLVLVVYVIGMYQPGEGGMLPNSFPRLNPFDWFYWTSSSSNSSDLNSKSTPRSDDSTNITFEPIVNEIGYGSRKDGLREDAAQPTNKVLQETTKILAPTSTTQAPFEPGSVLKMFTTTTKPRANDSDPIDQNQIAPRVKLNKKGRMFDYPLNPVALFNSSVRAPSVDPDHRDNSQLSSEGTFAAQNDTKATSSITRVSPVNVTTNIAQLNRFTSLLSSWWTRGSSTNKST